jgi:DNA-binding LacI/PurR family transcriptional regulator
MLGVSRIVTRAAVRALADAGLINPRPGVGCVVLGRGDKLWRGNVLFVSRTDGRSYYVNVFTATLRAQLLKAGWLFTQVTATPLPVGRTDTSELELQLGHPVTLAVAMFDNPDAEQVLSRSGVPFVTLGNKLSCRLKGCVGHVRFDRTLAAADLAAEAKAADVRSVMQVGVEDFDDVGAALKKAGIRTAKWRIPVPSGAKMPASVSFAVRDAFSKFFSDAKPGKGNLPDLIYFSDDYACMGALAAFAEVGVGVPEDVRVATWSNCGNDPVFARELCRMEMDPEDDAKKFSEAILAHLDGRSGAFPAAFGPRLKKGETL